MKGNDNLNNIIQIYFIVLSFFPIPVPEKECQKLLSYLLQHKSIVFFINNNNWTKIMHIKTSNTVKIEIDLYITLLMGLFQLPCLTQIP